jgi:hypothetical protein
MHRRLTVEFPLDATPESRMPIFVVECDYPYGRPEFLFGRRRPWELPYVISKEIVAVGARTSRAQPPYSYYRGLLELKTLPSGWVLYSVDLTLGEP